MNKTINEKKALRIVSYSPLVNYLSLFMLLVGMHKQIWALFALGIVCWIVSLFTLFWGAYSLGWEYKRLSLEDDAPVEVDE